MAYGRITQKQSEILEYIKSQILNKGYPPSVRDICAAVNLKSTSSVHAHLESLEKNGYIRRDPTKSRTIEIIDDNFNLARREVVNVPILGRVAAGEPLLAVDNITGPQISWLPMPGAHSLLNLILKISYIYFILSFLQFAAFFQIRIFKAKEIKHPIQPDGINGLFGICHHFRFCMECNA